ncbi:MAG: hypothetical protein V1861_03350 [Candidatus Micrarchaeota archaeon]
MVGPRQRQPEERRPAEVVVPQLSQQEIERRANAGYDRAVAGILAPQIRQLQTDLATLRNLILQRQRALPVDASDSARSTALDAAITAFSENNLNSPLGRYISTGATDFIRNFTWDIRGGRISFSLDMDRAPVESWLARPLQQAREGVVRQIVAASEPVGTARSRKNYALLEGLDPALVQQLGTGLSRELGIGPNQTIPRNHLPITVAYTDSAPVMDSRGRVLRHVVGLIAEYAGPRPVTEVNM